MVCRIRMVETHGCGDESKSINPKAGARRSATAVPLLIAFGQWRWCGQGRSTERLPAVDGFGLFRNLNYFYGLSGSTTSTLVSQLE